MLADTDTAQTQTHTHHTHTQTLCHDVTRTLHFYVAATRRLVALALRLRLLWLRFYTVRLPIFLSLSLRGALRRLLLVGEQRVLV